MKKNKKEKELKIIYIDPKPTQISDDIQKMMDKHDKQLNDKYGETNWHNDDLLDKHEKGICLLPEIVYAWLYYKRLPAIKQFEQPDPKPLFATYKKKRVKVNMASRFGDVGITKNLTAPNGYTDRGIYVPDLTDFSNEV